MFCYFIGLRERNTDLLSLVGYCVSSDRPGAGWLPCDQLRGPPTRPELPAPPFSTSRPGTRFPWLRTQLSWSDL